MKKVIKKLIIFVVTVIFILSIVIIGTGYKMYKDAITSEPLERKVAVIRSKNNYTKLSEMPQIYKDAVISVEDHRFYKHKGIDLISLGRALVNDIKAMEFVEGGSTITQQLSKNIYFTQKKEIIRKVAEVFMALNIEKEYSKEEILELYLNSSYFGDGYNTVKEAALGYFKKQPLKMTSSESIMLAGIPNAPSVYSPTKNPELSKQRQRQVAKKMVEYGYLTEDEEKEIIK